MPLHLLFNSVFLDAKFDFEDLMHEEEDKPMKTSDFVCFWDEK